MRRLKTVVSLVVAAHVAAGCAGSIEAPEEEDAVAKPANGRSTPGQAAGASAGGARVGGPGGGAGAPIPAPVAHAPCAADWSPSPAYLRRLTNREYDRTVADLLGDVGQPSKAFLPDENLLGFDNNYKTLQLSDAHAERYMQSAERLAQVAMGDANKRRALIGCELGGSGARACLESFVEGFGRRAFRRPLRLVEKTRLVELALANSDGGDPAAGVQVVVEAVLQSPYFLFRVETGAPDPTRPGWNRLRGPEIATRLAYTLWGTTPPPDLLAAADSGALDTASGIEAAARALLASGRAREALHAFAGQWLRFEELDHVAPLESQKDFKKWTPALRASMREEARRLIDEFAWGPGASFLGLLTANHGYVDSTLALLYGVPAPAGAAFDRVEFGPQGNRGGLLVTGALLAQAPDKTIASPVLRGKLVRDTLLCHEIPPPPPGVDTDIPTVPNQSEREMLESLTGGPTCAGCHALLNPVGFGLEQYGPIGAFRTVDGAGKPVTGKGRLEGLEKPEFTGPKELAMRLASAPATSTCVVRHVFRYAFGRTEEVEGQDACPIGEVQRAWSGAQHAFPELLAALIKTEMFRYVAANGGVR